MSSIIWWGASGLDEDKGVNYGRVYLESIKGHGASADGRRFKRYGSLSALKLDRNERVLQYQVPFLSQPRNVRPVATKTYRRAIPSFPLTAALSHLPTLCRYLETVPTVYCDKLNTKLWAECLKLAASHIVASLLYLVPACITLHWGISLCCCCFFRIVYIFEMATLLLQQSCGGKSTVNAAKLLTASLKPGCIRTQRMW